jgi:type I restriction enzyme S subunit
MMDVYKKTPLEKIPSDWKIEYISKVTDISIGKDLVKDAFSEFKTKEHIYPVYSNSHLNFGLYGYYNFEEYVGESVTVVGRGDVGLAFKRNGAFGAIGRLIILFPKNYLNNGYLTECINYHVKFHKESSAIPQLTGKQIGTYSIPIPPLPEQQKIVEILSTVDAKIEVIDQQITETQELKKGLMQRLLTKGIGHTEFKESTLGEIPESWEAVKIGDYMNLINGYAFKPKDWKTEGLPIIRIQNLNDNTAPFNYFDGTIDDKYYVNHGDLLFAWSGSKGISFGARMWTREKAVLNQHIFNVKLTEKINKDFAYYVLRNIQSKIENHAHGFKTSFVHVTKGDMNSVKFPLPPLDEQISITQRLITIDEKIEILLDKKSLYKNFKKGLMQQLLTGKVRVNV